MIHGRVLPECTTFVDDRKTVPAPDPEGCQAIQAVKTALTTVVDILGLLLYLVTVKLILDA